MLHLPFALVAVVKYLFPLSTAHLSNDASKFVTPPGFLSIVGNSQHALQESTLEWMSCENGILQG